MTAGNKLLDKAREACSLSSDAALASRIGVTRSQLSSWRVGREPIPEDRIASLARLAHLDAGEWLVLVEAEQAQIEQRVSVMANAGRPLSRRIRVDGRSLIDRMAKRLAPSS